MQASNKIQVATEGIFFVNDLTEVNYKGKTARRYTSDVDSSAL
jgi:hypothetical protein